MIIINFFMAIYNAFAELYANSQTSFACVMAAILPFFICAFFLAWYYIEEYFKNKR